MTISNANARQGIVILAASVMPIMAIVSLVPVLPLLQREFGTIGGTEFLVPMALTVPALCVALFSPIAGWISDRVGRKNLLVGSLMLYALFGTIPLFLDNLFEIIAARIALGIVEAIIMTVATTLIGDYFEDDAREKWIALQVAVGGIAATVLIALGGILGDAFGSRGPFLLYGLAVPVAIAAAFLLFEPLKKAKSDKGANAHFPYAKVVPLVLITLAVGIIFYTVNVKLGPILELSGTISPGTIGIIGALCNLAIGTGSFIFHRLKHQTGPRLLSLGLVAAAIGYGGLALSTSFALISCFAVVASLGAGLMLSNMASWTMAQLPPEVRGRGMGLWTGAFFLAQFLAPLVITAISIASAGMAQALQIYGIVIGMGAIWALIHAKTRPGANQI